jgi:hypothetical protein
LQLVKDAGNIAPEALEKQFRAEIGQVAAAERQGRHDLSHSSGTTIAGLTREMRELERTSARKENMKALEVRVNGRFDKFDRVPGRRAVVALERRAASTICRAKTK